MRNIARLESNPNVPAGHVHVLLTYLTSWRRLESDPNVETLLEMYPPTQTLCVTLPDVSLSQLRQFLQIDFARVVGVDDFKVSYRPEKISEEIYSWVYSLSISEERLNSALTLSVGQRQDLAVSTLRLYGAKPSGRIFSDQNNYCLKIYLYVFNFLYF